MCQTLYGVESKITDLTTIQEIMEKRVSALFVKVYEIAKKHDCIGVKSFENSIIYLFLVETNKNEFYNDIKHLVKCENIKEPIKVERTMLIPEA